MFNRSTKHPDPKRVRRALRRFANATGKHAYLNNAVGGR